MPVPLVPVIGPITGLRVLDRGPAQISVLFSTSVGLKLLLPQAPATLVLPILVSLTLIGLVVMVADVGVGCGVSEPGPVQLRDWRG